MANELVTWSDEFSVNNKTIDAQHQELVRMTNEFYAGCQMGGVMAKVYFLKTIQGAVNYVKTHFATEEEFMQKANYPEYEEHKKQHEDFVAQVIKAVKEFESGDTAPAAMANFLKNWLLEHIAKSDKQYAPYIAKLNS